MDFFQTALRKRISSLFFVGILFFGFSSLANVSIDALRLKTTSQAELIENRNEKKQNSAVLYLVSASKADAPTYNKYHSRIKTKTIRVAQKNCLIRYRQFSPSFTKIFYPRTAVSTEEDHFENS